MVSITSKGNFKNFEEFAKRSSVENLLKILNTFGRIGVEKLSEATPKDTGLTSRSWSYSITSKNGSSQISWYNSNTIKGGSSPSVAILLQYGHATKNGAWVEGRDFINPAIEKVFEQMAESLWKEVTK